MDWKERLKDLKGLAKLEREHESREEREKKRLAKMDESLERHVRSQVEKVCKKFARTVGWELSTDTGSFFYTPNKFYLNPKPRKEQSLDRLDHRITVGIDHYDQIVAIEPPGCPKGQQSAKTFTIPFADFTQSELMTDLERLFKIVYLSEEYPEEPEITHDEEIPGTLDLGWYYSEHKNEFQMAKIAEKDRATHFYVIGATGTGKTKFLEFLIQQDIEKGNGFGVIDPHGDLIEDIKGFLACRYDESGDEQEVSERVILIDPTDPE
ncbi:MAG: DUF87 domain-containing protein, partial [Methanocellales archaeon]|nr:DUF87 domain-containing protein [Methanocellales archaeon]